MHLKSSDEFYKIEIVPAFIGLELAFLMKMYLNYQTRKELAQKNKAGDVESGVGAGLFSSAGLTTIFNAMTQTTTTLCANG